MVSSTHALPLMRTRHAGVRAGTIILQLHPEMVSPTHLPPLMRTRSAGAHVRSTFLQSHPSMTVPSMFSYFHENSVPMFVRGLHFCIHIAALFFLYCPSLTLAWVQSTLSHMVVPFIDPNLSDPKLEFILRRHSRGHCIIAARSQLCFLCTPQN
jgi:hypothetical protein